MKNELSAPIFQLIQGMGSLADQMEQRVYLVGGFVRDLLLGEANFDLDVVAEGDGTDFASQLAMKLQVKTSVNEQFGTASLRLADGWRIDLATARTETYPSPGALPQVRPASLAEDLKRRDFSINAMAIALNGDDFGRLIDPCQGQEDLDQQQIRALHQRSFFDDPTRLIRAARFAARFSFQLEPVTCEMVERAAAEHLLRLVSPPRIREEILAVFQEKDPFLCLELLEQWGIWPDIDPQMPRWSSVCGMMREIPAAIRVIKEYFPATDKSLVYLTAICTGLEPENASELLLRLQVPHRYPKNVLLTLEKFRQFRLESPDPDPGIAYWHRLLENLPVEGIVLFLAADGDAAPAICRYLEKRSKMRLNISGEDLQLLGLMPGPERKRVLEQVYLARLSGASGGRQEEIDLARKIIAAKRGGNQ